MTCLCVSWAFFLQALSIWGGKKRGEGICVTVMMMPPTPLPGSPLATGKWRQMQSPSGVVFFLSERTRFHFERTWGTVWVLNVATCQMQGSDATRCWHKGVGVGVGALWHGMSVTRTQNTAGRNKRSSKVSDGNNSFQTHNGNRKFQ